MQNPIEGNHGNKQSAIVIKYGVDGSGTIEMDPDVFMREALDSLPPEDRDRTTRFVELMMGGYYQYV